MKTGLDVVTRALYLLQYTDANGVLDHRRNAELLRRALPVANQIAGELWYMENSGVFPELSSLEQEVPLSQRTLDEAMPYGVAMLLAQSEGDGDSQQLFSALYNRKRAGVRRLTEARLDMLPRGGDTV